jgi:squalene-hopene/tetraprenyl-beta-curcumene cyclase
MKGRSRRVAAIVGALLFAMACQPEDESPGFWLSGERASELIQDWRFTESVEEIFIETGTWYGVRHSTTIWCAELDGRLYIGSYDDDVKYWEENVARDPEARLSIEGVLYDVAVTPVADSELSRKLDERYAAKYDIAEVFGDDPPAWRYYRVVLRGRYGNAETLQFDDLAPEIVFGPYGRDDPRASEFSVERAAAFLDGVATGWGEKYQCVTCHTNGFYLTAPREIFSGRPAFDEARSQAQAFANEWDDTFSPNSILAVLGYTEVPETYVVATAAFLAIAGAGVDSELDDTTRGALDRAWDLQNEDGSWSDWIVCNWPPFESDEHFGVTLMAVAVGHTPASYRESERSRVGIERIGRFLEANPPEHIHQKGMLLWASVRLPGIVTETERDRWVDEISSLQRSDGAWASGDLGHWRQLDGEASDPPVTIESDGYGTGFAVFALLQAGIESHDPRVRNGVTWLKTNQREGGYWWTQSLKNLPDTSNFLTHTGTTFALKALAAAGETGETGEAQLELN